VNEWIIDQDLMALWWMHVWPIQDFPLLLLLLLILFLGVLLLVGVWQPSGSLTGFPSWLDKGRITLAVYSSTRHRDVTQTWRRTGEKRLPPLSSSMESWPFYITQRLCWPPSLPTMLDFLFLLLCVRLSHIKSTLWTTNKCSRSV